MPQKSWKSETVYRSKKSEWAFREDWIERRDRSALVTKVFEKIKTKGEKRRLENQVKGPNKDLRRLNALLEGKKMKKKTPG